MERTVERKFWECDTCEDTIEKPKGCPPRGWSRVIRVKRSVHFCPKCTLTAIRQLTDQKDDSLTCANR